MSPRRPNPEKLSSVVSRVWKRIVDRQIELTNANRNQKQNG